MTVLKDDIDLANAVYDLTQDRDGSQETAENALTEIQAIVEDYLSRKYGMFPKNAPDTND